MLCYAMPGQKHATGCFNRTQTQADRDMKSVRVRVRVFCVRDCPTNLTTGVLLSQIALYMQIDLVIALLYSYKLSSLV
jgi:hypothetical protein